MISLFGQVTSPTINKNVKLVFIFSFLASFGRGIWLGNILSAYIFFLEGESNIALGWTSVATGLPFTLLLFPSGYLSDRYRRDRLMQVAGIFAFIGLVTLAFASSFEFIIFALVFWGVAQGLTRPSLEALFADSVASGRRSGVYSKLHFTRNAAMSIGPFVNVGLFVVLGDVWELEILKSVMMVGLGISTLSVISIFFFSDDNSLGKAAEAIEINERDEQGEMKPITKRQTIIPYLLVTSNLLVGLGAGMTIKFFPIFFLDIYNLQPIPVNLILGFTSIFTGITALIAQRYSLQRGRVEMIIIVQLTATACLYLLATYPLLVFLVPLFIARGSLMNAAQPLSRSILMDYVPRRNRGKWNSIEALAWGLFWNFSAVIGGYLIDDISFRFAFLTTATIYVVGTLPLFFLIPLVRGENTSSIEVDEIDESTTKELLVSAD